MKYSWQGRQFSADANDVGRWIEQVRERRGRATPAIVLEEARSTRSPIHKLIDWDDKNAAEQHRIQQVRVIMGCLIVVVREAPEQGPTRALVAVSDEEESGRDYVPIAYALKSPPLRRQLIAEALRDLRSWQRKYRQLRELADVFAALEQAVRKVA